AALVAWHVFALPRTQADHAVERKADPWREFAATFAEYFRRENIVSILAFLLLFRFAEAQALKLVAPFLLDPVSSGGLGLTTSEVGLAYGTFGVAALTIGGILGGLAIARWGLARWLLPMVFAMHVPILV